MLRHSQARPASWVGACENGAIVWKPLSNVRLKLAALLLKEALCCLTFETSAAA